MTHHVKAEREIPVAAETLWHTIHQMTGMEVWYPGLIRESEVLEGDSVQPRRICSMQDGGTLKERILLRDAATRTFVYAIDSHPLPAKNVVGTIRIDDLGNGRSYVSWSASLALDPKNANQIAAMVTGMYEAGLASLEAHHLG
jgi:mxaD protein